MAVAPARRGPDILPVQSIPLSAVSDQPRAEPGAPPLSASADPADRANGVAGEITAAELAAADTARRGVAPEQIGETDGATATGTEDKTVAADDADDGIVVPKELPGYANKEIAKIRKQARERVDAAMKAAEGKIGEEEWQKLFAAARDQTVAKAQEDAGKAVKAAKDAQEALEAAQRQIEELKTKAVPAEPEKPDLKPTREDFDDPDAYDEAVVAWGKREGAREVEAVRKTELDKAEADKQAAEAEAERTKAEEAQRVRDTEVATINATWQDSRTKAIEKYADYVEVAEAAPEEGGPTITEAMAAAILQIPNGTDVAYHLGQNPDESLRIARLVNPVQHFIEIGRLAERLGNPPRQARRGRPVEIISDAPNSADTTDAEPDMETYAARRNAVLKKDSKPFFPASNMH